MYKNELWENDNYSHNPEVVGSNPASATKGQVWYRYIACTILLFTGEKRVVFACF